MIDSAPGMTWVGYVTQPDSEGSVQITSRDPQAALDIDVNYSCLMHIGGGLARNKNPIQVIHLAEILASRG